MILVDFTDSTAERNDLYVNYYGYYVYCAAGVHTVT